MKAAPARESPPSQSGFVLIEVLVSALIITIVAGAVLTLVTATTRSAADQRVHSTAFAVAQEDQARLRSMRLSSLNRLNQIRVVPLDGTSYTVTSTGTFVNNSSGNDSSCVAGSTSADYVRISSKVTWPDIGKRKPARIESIVAPSNGSLDPSHGTITITTKNGLEEQLSGVGVSATGAGSFSGATDSTGCANFSDLPSGNYSMTTSATGFVNKDGVLSPWTTSPISVSPGGTTPITLYYDRPGTIPVRFKYRVGNTSTFKTAFADSVVAYHAEMPSGAKSFGIPGGTRSEIVNATPIFPFKTAVTVYAGSCTSNNPNPEEKNPSGAPAMAGVIVPAGGTAPSPEIQLPALNLTVTKSGSPVSGARVTVTDESCKNAGVKVKRVLTTESLGKLTEPGLPWGSYEVCASSGNRHSSTSTRVSVKDLTSGTSLALTIPTSGSSGECQ